MMVGWYLIRHALKEKVKSEGNGRSEERIVESSGANEVDDLDGANMISSGCINHQGCRPTLPLSHLPPLP